MSNCFRIRELREKAGITQAELAFRLEVKSPSTISMWESGERKPSSVILPQLARALHCDMEDLYQRSG